MTSELINEALAEILQVYTDKRTNFCQLEIAPLDDESIILSGTVLDEGTLTAVAQSLSSQFPSINLDTSAVHILRQTPPNLAAISTNLAGLHARPSRSTEMVSQNVNGTVVEILREEGDWAFVRQMDGYLGWLLRPYLTTNVPQVTPIHMVSAPQMRLYAEPGRTDRLIGRIYAGTAVHIVNRKADWIQVELVGGFVGWGTAVDVCERDHLPQNAAQGREHMICHAPLYTGVPYRWGGTAVDGIDCSGFVQLLHRLIGITIPRDADMQFAAGTAVDPPFQPGDLLYFGHNKGHRTISHVAMSLGGWQIIHSSGSRNGVYAEDLQENQWLSEHFVGGNTFVGKGENN